MTNFRSFKEKIKDLGLMRANGVSHSPVRGTKEGDLSPTKKDAKSDILDLPAPLQPLRSKMYRNASGSKISPL
jgi:hypothetical protein